MYCVCTLSSIWLCVNLVLAVLIVSAPSCASYVCPFCVYSLVPGLSDMGSEVAVLHDRVISVETMTFWCNSFNLIFLLLPHTSRHFCKSVYASSFLETDYSDTTIADSLN